ncbi:hypothetical protein Tco_0754649 [Tanacetum coccineum]
MIDDTKITNKRGLNIDGRKDGFKTWLKKGNVVKVSRPWQFDRQIKHDGFHNTYNFQKDGVHITLVLLDTRGSQEDEQALLLK